MSHLCAARALSYVGLQRQWESLLAALAKQRSVWLDELRCNEPRGLLDTAGASKQMNHRWDTGRHAHLLLTAYATCLALA